jgi:antitoxin (DNA-binding transcriptional repressor) of toxin-antitoxin stability system
MKNVSMLEFRRNARELIDRISGGERMVLTYRGKPVVRLEPIEKDRIREDDPFYKLPEAAHSGGESMSNEEIDRTVYEQ